MGLTLYYADKSPAVRGTLLLIKALGLEVEFKPVDLNAGEQYSPEFLAMNPFHSVPTLKDGDFIIWDSQAINIYLGEKYGNNSPLYPNCPQKRAVINQRLFYNCGILFPAMGAIVVSLLREGAKSIAKDKAANLTEAYKSLETLLERSTYVAGDTLTLADLSIVATLTSAKPLVPIADNRFPKIAEWLTRVQALPYYEEANQVGLRKFEEWIKSMLA
ncbi:unnamed protein product [Phaedon cochleariae]|uniref:Glutathione S-transferase n=1 Tax=Phaedon cochleariae TaxID=80249 RepID=A0A9P0DHE6_PHACE|nr:unnamed protein product [Phaedon cochleariae]